ncbi:MAG TPA: ABC transporter ATP-binding protein [Kofleriaceae bacterium]|nr:ABC transporter ATP-binding protein [Kofleriaceae bacterium]
MADGATDQAPGGEPPAIEVVGLCKTYRTPLRRRRVEALRGVTFTVERGHIFGFVGPNGAGKTTTIRTLMGLIRPTSGRAALLGEPVPSRAARARVGFLPEAPYFYDYLTVGELLDLAGRLFGLPAAARRRRADELIERVGLSRARSQSLKKFSKGMLQRAGLAQALMNDPELVVLDEPMSGLDPIGRKEVRDLILELRDRGKTVFFSTHILSDVEAITDRVAIIARGQLQAHGTPSELVRRAVLGIDVAVRLPAGADAGPLTAGATQVRRRGDELALTLPADADADAWIARAHAAGAKVISVAPRHETLEELFLRAVDARGAEGADESAGGPSPGAAGAPAASASGASSASSTESAPEAAT